MIGIRPVNTAKVVQARLKAVYAQLLTDRRVPEVQTVADGPVTTSCREEKRPTPEKALSPAT
jgi:hypothetical protein